MFTGRPNFVCLNIFVCFFAAQPLLNADASEIMAKAVGRFKTVTLQTEVNDTNNSCGLWIQVEGAGGLRTSSIKHEKYMCDLYGARSVYIFEDINTDAAIIAVKLQRGGDGDHSGELLSLFSLSNRGLRQTAELELFDVSFVTSNQQLLSIRARKVFCFTSISCDGTIDFPFSISVPVKVYLGCDDVCVETDSSAFARDELLMSAENARKKGMVEAGGSQTELSLVEAEWKKFLQFLN